MVEAYKTRIDRLYQLMQQQGVELALVTSPINIYYFTGFYSNPHERFMGLFLKKDHEPILIVPALDVSEAKDKTFLKDIYGYQDSEGPEALIKNKVSSGQTQLLGFEQNVVTYQRALWIKELLSIENSIDIENHIMELRLIKDQEELTYIREAANWADKAVEIGIQAIQIGKSELEIIAEIEYRLKQQGIQKMSFDTMVLTGENSAKPHGKPGQTKIKKGDLVLFDLGVVLNGYCSDISRTVVVGKPTEKQLDMYNALKKAQQQAIEIVKPGVEIKQVDLKARNYLAGQGYGDYFIHRIGHGLGLDVHEQPSIHEKNSELLKEGMVFTIEPGIYIADVGGIRIEDDIVVTRTGAEVLTGFTKDLIVL